MPAITTNGKAAASAFSGRRVRYYRRPHGQWYYHPALRDGRFTRWDAPAMQQDDAVSIGLYTIYGPLFGATWEVRANNSEIKTFVENTLYRFWHHDLQKVLQHLVPTGTAIGEVLYEKDPEGYWKYAGLDDFQMDDVRALRRGRHLTGANVSYGSTIMMGSYTRPSQPNEKGDNAPQAWNELRHPKIFWCGHMPICGELYGRSTLETAWNPWMEKVGAHGAISIRKLWAFSNAYRGCLVKYPPGSTVRADGVAVPNEDIARELAENYCTGGALFCPSDKDENGNELWSIADPHLNGEIKGLMEYPDNLDRKIWQGMGCPDEVIHAPDVGGSWSGRSGPLAIFFMIEDMRVREIITAFDVGPSGYTTRNEQAGGVIRSLVMENFGPKAKYEIRPISLLPKPKEPGAGGTGQGGAPGQPAGGGGLPPEPKPTEPPAPSKPANPMGQPTAAKSMGKPAQPMGPRPQGLRLSAAADGVELPDEAVALALSGVWDPSVANRGSFDPLSAVFDPVKHPRGDEVNRGHFAHRGQTPAASSEPAKGESAAGNAALATAKQVYHYLHEKGAAGFAKLPTPVRWAASAAIAGAFAGWTTAQKLAERIAKEKGATAEQAAQLRGTLAVADLALFKPVALAAPLLGPVGTGAVAATWIVPPATAAYLVHSTALHPLATFRAAVGLVKDAAEHVKHVVDDHTQQLSAADPGGARPTLTDALASRDYDAWYVAILCAAMQHAQDATKAIGIAERIIQEHPQDKSAPQDDDANTLFAAPAGAKAEMPRFDRLPRLIRKQVLATMQALDSLKAAAEPRILAAGEQLALDEEHVQALEAAVLALDGILGQKIKRASLCYLAYSTARDPAATLNAAVSRVKGLSPRSTGDAPPAAAGDAGRQLASHIAAAHDPDAWLAAFCAALDAGAGAGRSTYLHAIALADETCADGPQAQAGDLALSAARAPRGYTQERPLVIQGTAYVGGEYIPGAVMAKATPAEKAAVEGGDKPPPRSPRRAPAKPTPLRPLEEAAKPEAHAPGDTREDQYLHAALRNLKKTSRTAQGTVDTSASKGKAANMAEGLTGDKAAEHAVKNFEDVMRAVYHQRDEDFGSPDRVQDFCDNANRALNAGITKEGVLLRTDDSDKFPYTKVADIPLARQQFAAEFAQRLSDPQADPIETAAWVEWRVNRDHVYADGCGKTQRALAALPLMRANLPLPNYDDPKKFFRFMPKTPPDPKQGGASYTDTPEYKKYLDYYRLKCPAFGSRAVRLVEKHFPPANREGIDAMERHAVNGGYGSGGGYTPERQALHRKIFNKLRGNVPPSQDKKYVMMGGGPASGKSSVIKAGLVKLPDQHVHIDSDAIKAELPEFQALKSSDLRGADYVHEESSDLAKKIQGDSFKAGQDVVLDGTGDSSLEAIEKKSKAARAAGYKVHASYTTCSVEEAVRRNLERAKVEGRLPPEDMLRSVHKNVSAILPQAIEKGLFDKVVLFDTEHKTNGQPTLVMSAQGSEIKVHHPQLWDSFLAKGKTI